MVTLKGAIKNDSPSGNNVPGSTIFTLPAGYRPSSTLMIIVYGGAVNSSIGVWPDGTVSCGTQFNTFLSLDGATFHAEQ